MSPVSAVAALSAVSSTFTVIVYVVPSDSPRRSAPAIVAVQVFELTEQVSVKPIPVIVTVSPFSTPLVVTAIVPSELSSAAFRYVPQLGTTPEILGAVTS